MLPFPKYAHFEVGLVGLVFDTRGGMGKGVWEKKGGGDIEAVSPRADKTKKLPYTRAHATKDKKSKTGKTKLETKSTSWRLNLVFPPMYV